MSQLANPDTPLEAPAPQDKAWTHLLHLETQVQLTQSSLTHHITKLSTLYQTVDLIFQSLQALLECLSPNSAPPMAKELAPPAMAPAPATPVTLQLQIPHPVLPDAYDRPIAAHGDIEEALLPPFHDVPHSGQQLPPPHNYSPSAGPCSSCLYHLSPTPEDFHGCGHGLTTPHGPAVMCKKPRHFAQHCPLGLEVCYLSAVEQEELFLQLLAAKDAAGALSLDKPSLELTPEEANMSTSPLELEGDF
ncbi:hypothetical protein C0989_003362 [Termitomyces sp. Mn162]|nr:hypothetical protein C0989_003362 [Termitomyces sp. Mn162]